MSHPEWAVLGADVAVIPRHYSGREMEPVPTTITKVTKAEVQTADGRRWRQATYGARDHFEEYASGGFTKAYLYSATHDHVVRYDERQVQIKRDRKVREAFTIWDRNRTVVNAVDAAAALTTWIEEQS